jgi:sugar phosphate permease
MFFQLPVILSFHYSPASANYITALFSVSNIPGGIICGWLSDLFGGHRASVIAVFMGLLCPLLYIFAWNNDASAGHGSIMPIEYNLMLLAIMGCLVGGPSNIIVSALAVDLAEDPSVKGRSKAVGTVTGIVRIGYSLLCLRPG